jgi:hypothetical protein
MFLRACYGKTAAASCAASSYFRNTANDPLLLRAPAHLSLPACPCLGTRLPEVQIMKLYGIRYTYDNPSSAGPFRGKAIVSDKYTKGDMFYGPFGRATVVSCSTVRQTSATPQDRLIHRADPQ